VVEAKSGAGAGLAHGPGRSAAATGSRAGGGRLVIAIVVSESGRLGWFHMTSLGLLEEFAVVAYPTSGVAAVAGRRLSACASRWLWAAVRAASPAVVGPGKDTP
jgi:hypothetical protein